ncbi:MAG TPA: phosphohistidine phosphatase SixA [Glaciecola sp.]|jgi:phosphohistidine phosphatase|nr:phosphohistidine phosphatase SixA [Glaciecola sp.]
MLWLEVSHTEKYMKLLIMRHGEAQLVADSDMQRPLTNAGINQVKQTAAWLIDNEIIPKQGIDFAFVSPYLRTRQTFAVLNEILPINDVEYSQDILPCSVTSIAHDYLDTKLSFLGQPECVLMVSHMPFVSYFVDIVCKQHISPLFATASVVVIEYDLKRSQGKLITHFQGI